MNRYDNEAIGNIVIMKDIIFYNKKTQVYEVDHSWNKGRPCLIIYSDEEYDYFLPFTSTERGGKYEKQYFPINEENILYSYDYKNEKKIRKKDIKGSINLEYVYKIPICGEYALKKITFGTYKKIIEALKEFHKSDELGQILEKATIARR